MFAVCFLVLGPPVENAYDVLDDPPSDCVEEPAEKIVFEGSQQPFLPIYFLQLDKMRQYVLVNQLSFAEVTEFNMVLHSASFVVLVVIVVAAVVCIEIAVVHLLSLLFVILYLYFTSLVVIISRVVN